MPIACKMLDSRQSLHTSKKLRDKENILREEVNKSAFRGKHRKTHLKHRPLDFPWKGLIRVTSWVSAGKGPLWLSGVGVVYCLLLGVLE